MMNHEECMTPYGIKFKTLKVKSSLCDYSDAYIHVKGTIANVS